MILIGNIRLGRDAETRQTNAGKSVTTLFGAYNYGRKGDDGKRPSQWVEIAFWGPQGESMAPYLRKGEQFLVTLSDVHVSEYVNKNGETKTKLSGTALKVDFASTGTREERAEPAKPAKPSKPVTSNFDDMDSDLPF